MKKLILMAVCLVATASVSAQNFSWGPKAGFSISNITSTDLNSRATFYVGGFAEFKFGDKFAVSPELLFSSQGGKMKKNGITSKAKFEYLNVPILAKYYVLPNLSIDLGPQIGFCVSAKAKAKVNGETHKESFDSDTYNKLDFSIPVGASYDFPMGLVVSARYNIGVTNVLKDAGSNKNSVFQIGAGWRF